MARKNLTAQTVPDEAYDATSWNGSLEVPTKNAVRDKIESMGGSGDVVGPGSATDKAIAIYSGTSGKIIANSNVTIDTTSGSILMPTALGPDTGAVVALQINSNLIYERTINTGVDVDGVLLKDGLVDGRDVAVDGAKLDTAYVSGGTDVPVTDGGTGRSTSTTAYGLIAAGTTATGAHQTLATGTTNQILKSNGSAALPTFQTGAPADVALGNVDNTSDATKNSAAVALTNKDLTSGTNSFPTFNQNTSGSAATLTTSRTIGTLTGDVTSAGSSFNGSANNTNSTTVTKINGTALSGLATGILKNTTTTGVPSIAVAADFPTLNQSTTGSAATLTTPRAIYGNNFDGSAALTQVVASTYGGTGNGFTKFSGPTTAEKTFTLPDATSTILTDNAAVTVAQGGTGRATGTTAYSLVATGTTATGAQQTLANGATTEILVGGGASALPVWTTAQGSGAPVRATSPTITTPTIASFANSNHNHTNSAGGGQITDAALSSQVTVAKGGTGAVTLTGLLQGNGTSAITGGATINDSNWSGTDLSVANGGTGASTLTGLLSGNGTGAITGSTTINDGNWSGTDLSVANGGTGASTLTGLVKGNGTSAFTAASAGTDYVAPSTISTNGKGYVAHGATAGTARPTGFASIEWVGSVEPTNATSADTWIDTA